MKKEKNIKPKKRRFKNEKEANGFTFVETLAVLAVGAVLAAGAGISGVKIVEQARNTSAKESISQFKAALQSYYIDCGQFPTTQQGLEALWTKPVLVPVPENWNGPYLDEEVKSDPWGSEFIYMEGRNALLPIDAPLNMPFIILSYGANKTEGGEGNDKDIVSWK